MQIQIAPAPRPVTSRRHSALLASGLSALFMAACGGGGSPAAAPTQTPATSVTVSTAVTTDTGATITGATVSVATGSGSVTLTQDAITGGYSIAVPTSELPAISAGTSVVVTISKDGYVPEAVVITPAQLAAAIATSAPVTIPTTTLTAKALTDLTPSDGLTLVRLGNGLSVGGANEKLQTPASLIYGSGATKGTSKQILLGSFDSLFSAGGSINYTKVTLSATFRGLQATFCADKVTLFQSANADGSGTRSAVTVFDATTSPVQLADFTDADSKVLTFQTATTALIQGLPLVVEIASGACVDNQSVVDALDDFEFYNVQASFSN